MATTIYNMNRGYIGNATPDSDNSDLLGIAAAALSIFFIAALGSYFKSDFMYRILEFVSSQQFQLVVYSIAFLSAFIWGVVHYVSIWINNKVHK